MLQILPPSMAAPLGLATLENEWTQLFGQYIPTWLAVTDPATLEAYIQGTKSESTLYVARHLRAWLVPVLMWSLFVCVLMFVKLCINVILKKQWMERERLAFPIAQLPFEMTVSGSGLFQNRLFWISFTVVGGIGIINGLHFFFPYVPYLRVRPYNIGQFFTTPPWDAFGYAPLTFRPFMAGLIFLIPLDMSFSCWFFFFFWKARATRWADAGISSTGGISRTERGRVYRPLLHRLVDGETAYSAYLQRHVPFGGGRKTGTPVTPSRSVTTPLFGALSVGSFSYCCFCWQAGMTFLAAGVFFVLYLMTQIGITRVRAEVGSPIHDLHFAGPEYLMVDAVGTRKLGAGNLSILSFFWFLTRAHYSDVMPHQLEGFKLSDRGRFQQPEVGYRNARRHRLWHHRRFLGDFGFRISAQRGHYVVGRLRTIQTLGRVAQSSQTPKSRRDGILCIRATLWDFPDGHARPIYLVAIPSGGVRGLQHLRYARLLVHVPTNMVGEMADFKARRAKSAPSSAPPLLRHDPRRICHWRILGTHRYCLQNADV